MRFILIVIVTLMAWQLHAQQKYGHLNTGNVLESMPAVAKADSTLKVFQTGLQQKEEEMIAAFEKEYMEFAQKAQAGELPKMTIDKKQQEFQKKEQEIK